MLAGTLSKNISTELVSAARVSGSEQRDEKGEKKCESYREKETEDG